MVECVTVLVPCASSTQIMANKPAQSFESCWADCLRPCDRAHKRPSITMLCHHQHLQQHRSSVLFKQQRRILPVRLKQIQNELHFLIFINLPSSQLSGSLPEKLSLPR